MDENNNKKWECPKTLKELLEQIEEQKSVFHKLNVDINEENDDQTIINKLRDQANKQLGSAEKLHDAIEELIDSLRNILKSMKEWQKEIDDGLFEEEE